MYGSKNLKNKMKNSFMLVFWKFIKLKCFSNFYAQKLIDSLNNQDLPWCKQYCFVFLLTFFFNNKIGNAHLKIIKNYIANILKFFCIFQPKFFVIKKKFWYHLHLRLYIYSSRYIFLDTFSICMVGVDETARLQLFPLRCMTPSFCMICNI